MYPQFTVEQKAAARALLELQCPTQELVAAAVGTTRQSMTAWVSRWNWSFVDFRLAGSQDAQEKHRSAMFAAFGKNQAARMRQDELLQTVWTEADAEKSPVLAGAAPASAPKGAAAALVIDLQDGLRTLVGRMMQGLPSPNATTPAPVEAVFSLLDKSERLLAVLAEDRRRMLEAFDKERARYDADFEEMVEDRALEMAAKPAFRARMAAAEAELAVDAAR